MNDKEENYAAFLKDLDRRLAMEQYRWRAINGPVCAHYQPDVITLQSYGMEKIFGEYHVKTGEFTITDDSMLGDMTIERLQQYAEDHNMVGSHILFGVPKEVYALRQKFEYEESR